MTTQHTPAPWIVGKQNIATVDGWKLNRIPVSGNGQAIAAVWNGSQGKGELSNGEANARLIAAAPYMLAVLQEVERILPENELLDDVRTAINKATGLAPA